MDIARPIAFIGAGFMGTPMAIRLVQQGETLRAWNRTANKLLPVLAAGALNCASPSEAANGVRFVCLSLTDADAVEAVLFGAGGVVESLDDDAILLDFSTIGPTRARALARRLGDQTGASWLDCPVSGGPEAAASGSLIMFVGGDQACAAAANPILKLLAKQISFMGPLGSGQATKLSNQLIVATNLVAIAEALALVEQFQTDPEQLPSALRNGFADSQPLRIFGPRMAAASDPGPSTSRLATMLKDVRLTLDEVSGSGANLPLLRAAERVYAQLMRSGHGEEDIPALIKAYRSSAS